MTGKVVKGSIWTLGGQVAPIFVSLVTTPLVIRLLGAESYGVLTLMVLIPSYLSFADFGMAMASTRFGSEAYAQGDPEKEARVIRTAALVALISAVPTAAAIWVFSNQLALFFNVPNQLLGEAVLALRIASVTLVVNFLNGIFSAPQVARLRMDLHTFVTAGVKMLALAITPVVVYFGYGVVGATLVLMVANLLTLTTHIIVSRRLLPPLQGLAIEGEILRPICKFGGALVLSGIAGVLLVNLEKLVLVRYTSVQDLAFYSIASSLAMMATMVAQSLVHSLVPAFSQLFDRNQRGSLQSLFSRSLRIVLIALIPTLVVLFVTAKPIFIYMGGEDFGRESTWPFRILLFGLLFNVLAYTPYSLLMGTGQSSVFAKLYWIELIPYVFLTWVLAGRFGAEGAAAAWTLRVMGDAIVLAWVATRKTNVSFDAFRGNRTTFAISLIAFGPSIVIAALFGDHANWLLLLLPFGLVIYAVTVWKCFLDVTERDWIFDQLRTVSGK